MISPIAMKIYTILITVASRPLLSMSNPLAIVFLLKTPYHLNIAVLVANFGENLTVNPCFMFTALTIKSIIPEIIPTKLDIEEEI